MQYMCMMTLKFLGHKRFETIYLIKFILDLLSNNEQKLRYMQIELTEKTRPKEWLSKNVGSKKSVDSLLFKNQNHLLTLDMTAFKFGKDIDLNLL